MIYLLDTTAVSDLMAEDARTITRFAAARRSDEVRVSVVVLGEIHYGIERLPAGKRRELLVQKTTNLFPTLAIEPVTATVIFAYASVRNACKLTGVAIDDNDRWIAAAAIQLDAVVVTRDRDFTRYRGVRVQDWSA